MTKESFAVDRPEDVSEDAWADFVRLRRAKKAPITATAIKGFRREADRAGITLQEAIEVSCQMGWQGFRADWYSRMNTTRHSTGKTAWQQGMASRVAEFTGKSREEIFETKGVIVHVANQVDR